MSIRAPLKDITRTIKRQESFIEQSLSEDEHPSDAECTQPLYCLTWEQFVKAFLKAIDEREHFVEFAITASRFVKLVAEKLHETFPTQRMKAASDLAHRIEMALFCTEESGYADSVKAREEMTHIMDVEIGDVDSSFPDLDDTQHLMRNPMEYPRMLKNVARMAQLALSQCLGDFSETGAKISDLMEQLGHERICFTEDELRPRLPSSLCLASEAEVLKDIEHHTLQLEMHYGRFTRASTFYIHDAVQVAAAAVKVADLIGGEIYDTVPNPQSDKENIGGVWAHDLTLIMDKIAEGMSYPNMTREFSKVEKREMDAEFDKVHPIDAKLMQRASITENRKPLERKMVALLSLAMNVLDAIDLDHQATGMLVKLLDEFVDDTESEPEEGECTPQPKCRRLDF